MRRYQLAICAVVKNEAIYLQEWISFHKLLGVEHFFIYENDSSDHTRELLNTYHSDLVTVIEYPVMHPQLPAYAHYLQYHKKKTEWTAFIDVDEFLWSPKYVGREDPILSALADCTRYWFGKRDGSTDTVGAVAVHWLIFGSGGAREYKEGPVTERFTRRADCTNKHVKSIVRSEAVREVGKDPHTFYLHDGFAASDESGNDLPMDYAIVGGESAQIIAINHYHTKSREEYFKRKLDKPDSGARVIRDRAWTERSFTAHDRNDVEDTRLKDAYSKEIRPCLIGL